MMATKTVEGTVIAIKSDEGSVSTSKCNVDEDVQAKEVVINVETSTCVTVTDEKREETKEKEANEEKTKDVEVKKVEDVEVKIEKDAKVKKGRRSVKKRRSFLCTVNYHNNLPDIPFDPKFIKYPFQPNRFVRYSHTALERTDYQIHTETDLGIRVDLIDPYAYTEYRGASLTDKDEQLLEEEVKYIEISKRSMHHRKWVPWLRKAEFSGDELHHFGQDSPAEVDTGDNMATDYSVRENQILAINKRFSDAKIKIDKHFCRPGVYAVQELPVFPDFELWKHPFAYVSFDRLAGPSCETPSKKLAAGFIGETDADADGKRAVVYYLPTEETLKIMKKANEGANMDDHPYKYNYVSEHDYEIIHDDDGKNFFLVERDESATYVKMDVFVKLKQIAPGRKSAVSTGLKTFNRPATEFETGLKNSRLKDLEPFEVEEEEEQG